MQVDTNNELIDAHLPGLQKSWPTRLVVLEYQRRSSVAWPVTGETVANHTIIAVIYGGSLYLAPLITPNEGVALFVIMTILKSCGKRSNYVVGHNLNLSRIIIQSSCHWKLLRRKQFSTSVVRVFCSAQIKLFNSYTPSLALPLILWNANKLHGSPKLCIVCKRRRFCNISSPLFHVPAHSLHYLFIHL